MNNVCVVTTARSEYGVLRWIIDEIFHHPEMELQLVVTGGHLSLEQGHTVDFIINDGYPFMSIDFNLVNSTSKDIVLSMGRCQNEFATFFAQFTPDLLVVLGDRYELLPICSSALIMNIPIAHISGGDVTDGAIDDVVRNAVTMMATIHFPGVEASARNIARMRNSDANIHTVGEPGLDNFNKLKLWDRDLLARNLNLNPSKRWVLMTYHAETRSSIQSNVDVLKNIFRALGQLTNIEVVITKANGDLGGLEINRFIERYLSFCNLGYQLIDSLGQTRYLSLMKQAWCVIGNSSSGVIEAPMLQVPVVNIGSRQKGRHLCANVIQVEGSFDAICSALNGIDDMKKPISDGDYWGDGNASGKIVSIINEYLKSCK